MSVRQFFLGLTGGSIAAVSFYNFSRTSMENDFDFMRSKLDRMSSQLQTVSRMQLAKDPLEVLYAPERITQTSPPKEIIRHRANLLDAIRDAWNRTVYGIARSMSGRW
ncbi:hypothetical protein RI367_004317 [Sorochytrium milnesiophthora]